ncbi:MAG: hypothetical protein U0942_04130 [Parvibaculum sp.]|uniref:hypothetical protein n=1 Tax=Parvibaculum sp. TaxID=2024848 RepID=UPI002ABCF655|nr:hypothetical protein [Parvibaculum sp.]MDZ4380509.1 hypothetical protein [Parvibaculum sp.]
MRNEMTLERLREIVEAYGASPARWPQAERLAAEGLTSSSREAQALVADAARFDALLDMAPAEAPSAALTERLMAARPRAVAPLVPARPQKEKGFLRGLLEAVWPYGSAAFPAGTLAAALVMGVALGSASDISLSLTGTAVTASTETETGEGLIALAMADQVWPEEWMQ